MYLLNHHQFFHHPLFHLQVDVEFYDVFIIQCGTQGLCKKEATQNYRHGRCQVI
jgi:hypothetical protein